MTGLLQDKVITITGASSGIGHAIAIQCKTPHSSPRERPNARRCTTIAIQNELQSRYKTHCIVFAVDLSVDGVAEGPAGPPRCFYFWPPGRAELTPVVTFRTG